MFKYNAVVDYVVDGDTVDLSIDLGFDIWHKTRVRLLGIDTPEKWYNYGKVVKAYVVEQLEGKPVQIVSTKQDKYGRYLVQIYLDSGVETFNKHLIDQGMAKSYFGAARGSLWRDDELDQRDHELLVNKLDSSVFKD
jgi:micrococcal nuclease